MTPVHRALSGQALHLDLEAEMGLVRKELEAGHSRIARTLVKEGPLRVTLVGLNAGAVLREHTAEGPITIHVLDGEIVLHVGDGSATLRTHDLVSLHGGVAHRVESGKGGFFLLTLSVATNPPI